MSYRTARLRIAATVIFAIVSVPALLAQARPQPYTLFLEDAPAAERFVSRDQLQSDAAALYRRQIEARQQAVKSALAARRFQITGSASTLLNAVFVVAPAGRLDELKAIPGVKAVVAGRRFQPTLNRATQLLNGPAAWTAVGGIQNAGAGIKIAIIDTGIDQTHPAFIDNSLTPPAGFPICKTAYPNGTEVTLATCSQYTNNKVIVARSYVPLDAAGSDPTNPALDSTPDDASPRDRIGHGTGTASAAAGVPNTGPSGLTFNGMAPKAFLGNYKVFGSPEVNDFATDPVLILALEDALKDGMDIASLSLGQPAMSGPLDTGAVCGNAAGVPCDPVATAVENAVKAGMVVVIAAGNDGDGSSSFNAPTLGSIESPGSAPSAITVGSTTNSHYMTDGGVIVPGSDVPSSLQNLAGMLGDGPIPTSTVSGPLVDVTTLGDSGLACGASLPAGSLSNSLALIERGSCNFSTKVTNAQNAGALGVILYMADASAPIPPGGLTNTGIPAIMISNADGLALKSFIDSNSGHVAAINPAAFEQLKAANQTNLLSYYSSLGPTTGTNAIKPDLVATGGSDEFFTDIYLAAESYDPLGPLYSPDRYTAGSGTSFATPLVAGAAALVKQAHPHFSPAQIKSALVNTASQVVTLDETSNPVGVQQLGAGLLDAKAALAATITVSPSALSFGAPTTFPVTQQLQVTNVGASAATLSVAVTPRIAATAATVTVDQPSLNLAAGATGTIRATLSGSLPLGGSYSGFITIQGNGTTLHVPYLFFAPSPLIGNLIAISAPGDVAAGLDAGSIAVRLVDANGLPVSGSPISFTAPPGASLKNVQSTTNSYGIASAEATLGPQVGPYAFSVSGGGMSFALGANALPQPLVSNNAIVNGASFAAGDPVAPGSYIAIFGYNLSLTTNSATTSVLPLAIDFVNVSFDVPSAGISVPGHLVFASPNQVNLQVPWELEGQTSAQVKVILGDGAGVSFGNVVTLALANYAPAFFVGGGNTVAALDAKMSTVTSANAARSGQTIELFANGLGPVNNQPASGEPATTAQSTCVSTPIVTIAGQQAPVAFCGLAPGFPGLYQLNVTVPSGLASGTYPITVTAGGIMSKAASLAVQ